MLQGLSGLQARLSLQLSHLDEDSSNQEWRCGYVVAPGLGRLEPWNAPMQKPLGSLSKITVRAQVSCR